MGCPQTFPVRALFLLSHSDTLQYPAGWLTMATIFIWIFDAVDDDYDIYDDVQGDIHYDDDD